MHCKKPLSAAIACVLFMLSGCDKTVESNNYRVGISPSLGFIKNAKVRIYAADGRTLIGKGSTGSEGQLGLYPGRTNGPVVIAVIGSSEATYFDEYLQAEVNFPAGYSMHALVNNAYGSYGVSPLTELAYRIAVDQELFPLTANEVNILNNRVGAALAPELNSIISPVTIIDGAALADLLVNPLQDNMANRYALRLMALAELGAADPAPALAMMSSLSADILDGVIDDLDKNSDPLTTPYDPNTLQADMGTIMTTLAGQYASTDLQGEVSGYPAISLSIDLTNINDGSNFSGCVDDAVSTLPAEVAGESLNMRFETVDAAAPFANNEVVLITFCSNGQMRITNDYMVVSSTFSTEVDPLDPIPVIYTWRQSSNRMLYELVVLSNVIYEMNVYGENGSIYFGRFTPY